MPGIFGVVDLVSIADEARSERTAIARAMAAAMRYESFYSVTVMSCPAVGACVGRVDLCWHGPTDWTETVQSASIVAVTTGDDSLDAAVPFGMASATGADVVDAYQCRPEDGLATLPGIRSGFLADRAAARCVLFNDRYGKERIFVHRAGHRVFFASEAKAILAVAPETRAFDAQGLADLLACGCTVGGDSLFRGLRVLEPGTVLTIAGRRIEERRYFDRQSLEQLPVLADRQRLEEFREHLRTEVNRSVRQGPQVALSLTGGVDSRMLMASLDAPPATVPCYTFGSMYRVTGDVRAAKRVAACCAQPHHVIELGADFVANLPKTLEESVYIADGYLGLSGAAELYVNRRARSIAPARMTGNWGGELLRGARAFQYAVPKGDFLGRDLAAQIETRRQRFRPINGNSLSAVLFQQMPLHGYGRNAIERSQLLMRHPFLSDDVVKWSYQSSPAIRQATACAAIGQRPELLTIPTDRGTLGVRTSRLRTHARRALIKAEYLTSHGAPNWIARVSARLPASLIERRFLGVDKFQHFRLWTRQDLAGWVRDTLVRRNNGTLDNWFDMDRVRRMVEDHIEGRGNYMDEIDKLVTLAVADKTLLRRFAHTPA